MNVMSNDKITDKHTKLRNQLYNQLFLNMSIFKVKEVLLKKHFESIHSILFSLIYQ
jgi:hypothetical protein